MQELLHGGMEILLYFAVCATSALVAHALLPIPSEVFRKILHLILLGSLAVWVLQFSTWWLSVLTAVIFALAVYPLLSLAERLKGYSALLTERKGGEIKHSLLLVFTMYALVACICWGWLGDKLLALASIYAWGFGDAAAALLLDIGLQLGRGERLLLVLRDEQVVGFDLDDGVHLQTIGDMLQGIGEDAVLPVLGLP